MLPASRTCIHMWNEPYLPVFSPSFHRTLAGSHFSYRYKAELEVNRSLYIGRHLYQTSP